MNGADQPSLRRATQDRQFGTRTIDGAVPEGPGCPTGGDHPANVSGHDHYRLRALTRNSLSECDIPGQMVAAIVRPGFKRSSLENEGIRGEEAERRYGIAPRERFVKCAERPEDGLLLRGLGPSQGRPRKEDQYEQRSGDVVSHVPSGGRSPFGFPPPSWPAKER